MVDIVLWCCVYLVCICWYLTSKGHTLPHHIIVTQYIYTDISQRAPAKNNRSFCAGGDCGPIAPVATQAPFSPAPAQRSQPDTTVCSGEEGPASQKGAQAPIVSTARRCHSFGAPAAPAISRFFFGRCAGCSGEKRSGAHRKTGRWRPKL